MGTCLATCKQECTFQLKLSLSCSEADDNILAIVCYIIGMHSNLDGMGHSREPEKDKSRQYHLD